MQRSYISSAVYFMNIKPKKGRFWNSQKIVGLEIH